MRSGNRLIRGVFGAVAALLGLCLLSGAVGIDPKLAVAAALVIVVFSNLGRIGRLLKQLAIVGIAILMLPIVLSQLIESAGPLRAILAVALVSLCAYWIREHRLRKRSRQPKVSGAERTPVLPTSEWDS